MCIFCYLQLYINFQMQRTNSYRKANDRPIASLLKKKIQSMLTPSLKHPYPSIPHYPKANQNKENNINYANVDQTRSRNTSAICKTQIESSLQPTCHNHPSSLANFCCWLDNMNISYFCEDCAIQGVQKNYRLLRLNNHRFSLVINYQKQKQQLIKWQQLAQQQLNLRITQLQQSMKKFYQKLLENVHECQKNTVEIIQLNINSVLDIFNSEKNLLKASKFFLQDKQQTSQHFNIAELCRLNRESVPVTIQTKKSGKTIKRQINQFTYERQKSKQKLNYFQKKIIKMSKKKSQREKNTSMDFSSIVIE